MNWKTSLIAAGFMIALLAICYFIRFDAGYKEGVKDTIARLKQDSIKIDTTKADQIIAEASDIEIEYIPAGKKEITKQDSSYIVATGILDTTLADAKGDTVSLKGKLLYDESINGFQAYFDNIIIKPIEKTVTVVKTIYKTVTVEVPTKPPFYNTYLFGFINGIILFVIGLVAW